ncbi:acyl-coenzyme A oxidase-like protein [Capsaspora owczarzaki ATCC 30864]|uniref:Acyl-coenzyme A oxidase n=1 Tax=Capsaspora owczarzaki (strain ATCC 30864) TaxID=595528 RepID=A0A0D2U4X7_CAPO3|nr:acyl-coenzyme A oxidase-like protein [Capsaspora owczarzaki ATCC 30864]KJE90211.1 acyl-coenzyme A oxidase-like protein [Capsaspora owczarzaki ATCC 30864]|eukprot:XP_004364420.1 acyl-coenzyme A oxidase-like protein [Capsaspora owczarzaki ATCC 30864]
MTLTTTTTTATATTEAAELRRVAAVASALRGAGATVMTCDTTRDGHHATLTTANAASGSTGSNKTSNGKKKATTAADAAATIAGLPAWVGELRRELDGEFYELKDELRHFLDSTPLFDLRFGLSTAEQRKITQERALTIIQSKVVQSLFAEHIARKPGSLQKGWASGEIMGMTDLSVNVKLGVMTWLFGGAVMSLGSDELVAKWFAPLARGEFTGMFAMTEIGHGSNVRSIETLATYDPKTQEFVITTPHPYARKAYIGNALNGEYAVVFANLVPADGKSRGPHAFVVPMRSKDKVMYPGVSVWDMGEKEGLNGVDNGVISFSGARIPRDHLLNRFADVDAKGNYTTTIASDSKRFNAMLAALTGTRVALASSANCVMKVGLAIAIRYAARRRQFGPSPPKPKRGSKQAAPTTAPASGASSNPAAFAFSELEEGSVIPIPASVMTSTELPILAYQTHQTRLMPLLAASLAIANLARHAAKTLEKCAIEMQESNREVQALCAGLKAYSSWKCIESLQTARECCGGQGYLAENRLVGMRADTDIYVTFEGDNIVLLQQVAKELIAQYAAQFETGMFTGILSFFSNQVVLSLKTSRFAARSYPVSAPEFHVKALAFKEAKLLTLLAKRLLQRVKREKKDPFLAWNECLDHIVNLSTTHIERVCVEKFYASIATSKASPRVKEILSTAAQLHAASILYRDRAWYLEHNYMTTAHSCELRDIVLELSANFSRDALAVVEAFGIPDRCLHAPIAGVVSGTTAARNSWSYFSNALMDPSFAPRD